MAHGQNQDLGPLIECLEDVHLIATEGLGPTPVGLKVAPYAADLNGILPGFYIRSGLALVKKGDQLNIFKKGQFPISLGVSSATQALRLKLPGAQSICLKFDRRFITADRDTEGCAHVSPMIIDSVQPLGPRREQTMRQQMMELSVRWLNLMESLIVQQPSTARSIFDRLALVRYDESRESLLVRWQRFAQISLLCSQKVYPIDLDLSHLFYNLHIRARLQTRALRERE